MNKFSGRLLCATALILSASPALANKADKLFLSQQHDKITVARAEPGLAQNGQSDLDRADAVLVPLNKRFSGDDRKAQASISNEIDAIIGTARAHNSIATMKTQIVQLQARNSSRLAAAEVAGAAAQRSASDAEIRSVAAQTETTALRSQLRDSQKAVASAQLSATEARSSAAASQAESSVLRDQMRDYQLKQTLLGATLVLSDVSFVSGRADLQAGAVERLRPLANYLDANPAVRVHIDGHTDGQGSSSANQSLSDRRADSVSVSLSSMGVSKGRIEAVGHGEMMPVADNATVDGRQQNRRVEITLVGQKAMSLAAQ